MYYRVTQPSFEVCLLVMLRSSWVCLQKTMRFNARCQPSQPVHLLTRKPTELSYFAASTRKISQTSFLRTSDQGRQDGFIDEDSEYEPIGLDSLRLGEDHNVFVLQPDIIGSLRPTSMSNTTPELQLSEAVALVDCLPGWKVCGKMIIRTSTPDEQIIFKGQRLKKLCDMINECPQATALFLSLDSINGIQRQKLIEHTKLEHIFDRYMLVLEIFRLRAQTKQAKLQVALAEIPYIRSNLKSEILPSSRQGGGFNAVGGPGESPLELMKRQFRFREQKIKKKLVRLRKKRTEQREIRRKGNLPVVAVVGYTNAGKTTLIKALSKSEKLKPKNHLFATLDVTTHAAVTNGNMSSGGSGTMVSVCEKWRECYKIFLQYLLVDTVGFLSNLPHSLIDAFAATMEDMLEADMILHVCDISHPDYENQRRNVYHVLSELRLSPKLLESMVEVRNKIDLVSNESSYSKPEAVEVKSTLSTKAAKQIRHQSHSQPSIVRAISATKGTGLESLDELLHSKLVQVTGGQSIQIRVPANGDHLDWLNEYATVDSFDNDDDYHFIIDFTISEGMWNKFKARYHAYRVL